MRIEQTMKDDMIFRWSDSYYSKDRVEDLDSKEEFVLLKCTYCFKSLYKKFSFSQLELLALIIRVDNCRLLDKDIPYEW